MRKFHALTVTSVRNETPDSLRIALDVPEALRDEFVFLPGQHLPVQAKIDGKLTRSNLQHLFQTWAVAAGNRDSYTTRWNILGIC